jgi:hypothetical protein
MCNILIEFRVPMKEFRLIKMSLNDTYIKVGIVKHLIIICTILLCCVDLTLHTSFFLLGAKSINILSSFSLYCLYISASPAIMRPTSCCDDGTCCSV